MGGSSSLYNWWIENTQPNHPVLDDSSHQLYQALGIQTEGPAVYVVNCKGDVTYSKWGDLNSQSYTELKGAVQQALSDRSCIPKPDAF